MHTRVLTLPARTLVRVHAGTVALVLILLIFDNALRLVGTLVGFLYPAYMSFKAIESVNKTDDTQWLVYWVVYAAFSVIEIFTGACVRVREREERERATSPVKRVLITLYPQM